MLQTVAPTQALAELSNGELIGSSSPEIDLDVPQPPPMIPMDIMGQKRGVRLDPKDVVSTSIEDPQISLGTSVSEALRDFFFQSHKKRKTGVLPDSLRRLAIFSDTAYKKTVQSKINAIQEYEEDWVVDREYTSKYMTVYVNKEDKCVVTAFRGADNKDPNTLHSMDHVAIAHEKVRRRIRQALRRFEKMHEQYGAYEHVLTGHSMGAVMAKSIQHEFKKLVAEVHVFNPGSSVKSVRAGLRTQNLPVVAEPRVHEHYIIGDAMSRLGRDQTISQVHLYDALIGSKNIHSIKQFLS